MLNSKARIVVAAWGLAAALALAPSASEGGLFDWMCPSPVSPPAPSAATFAPPFTAQRFSLMPIATTTATVCQPVARTCYYVPQTSYRWSYSRMSFTRYQPVTSWDPCTGCVTTAYRPVTRTTLLPWLHRKPVTTYQLVCSNGCVPSCPPACSPCCPPATISSGVVGTVLGSGCPSGCVPATTIPGPISSTPSSDSGYAPPSTFKTEEGTGSSEQASPSSDLRLRPSSELNRNPASTREPRLIDPYHRSAAKPIQYATYAYPIKPAPSANAALGVLLDVGGWRPSSD